MLNIYQKEIIKSLESSLHRIKNRQIKADYELKHPIRELSPEELKRREGLTKKRTEHAEILREAIERVKKGVLV